MPYNVAEGLMGEERNDDREGESDQEQRGREKRESGAAEVPNTRKVGAGCREKASMMTMQY
eukprot:9644639-Heterocapsa_arctica.AAC.1